MKDCARYVTITPTPTQISIEKMGFYCFFHFGLNTFTDREWGDGKDSPDLFCPSDLDTDDWCRTVASAGAKGVILTAKHHDGFCLWQTDTTDYSVRSSPWRGGKGDIVAMLADSCRKFGLKMGAYLSPWDRNSPKYGTDEYDDFYCAQLTELLTRYGEMFTVWLDGACGSHLDGKPMQRYDFERYYAVIRRLQPDCAISNCGPDVRWVGNEAGVTRHEEWNVVPASLADPYKVAAASQSEDAPFESKLGAEDEDLGSRAVLEKCGDLIWYPAEADVSIRPGWFFHSSQNRKVKSVNKLLSLWYKTVGGNCMLLLNVPPDKRGRIYEKDAATLRELGERLKSAFAVKAECEDESLPAFEPAQSYAVTRTFVRPCEIDKAVIAEDIRFSQRVERFALYAETDGGSRKIYEGTTIGHLKIALFDKVLCNGLTMCVESCRMEPHIERLDAYAPDGTPHPKERFAAFKRWVTRFNYKMYLFKQELAKKRVKKSQNRHGRQK